MNNKNIFKTAIQSAAVRCPFSLPYGNAQACEFTLSIGLFFDGTDNNKDGGERAFCNTNVVRLWEAYRDHPDDGSCRHYVTAERERIEAVSHV